MGESRYTPMAQSISGPVPAKLPPMPCGGIPLFDSDSGCAYRCDQCFAVIGSCDACASHGQAPAARPAQEAEPLLDYAMQIAHERELRVTGFPHDEDGAKRVFEAAVMRHTATGAPQAADSVQEDAARYRWLRDGDWREHEKLESVIRLQLNALWDETIDAAMNKGDAA